MSVKQARLTRFSIAKIELSGVTAGLLGLIASVPLAFLIGLVHSNWPDQPERAVMIVAAMFALILTVPAAWYLLSRRAAADPAKLGLLLLSTIGVLLVSVYLYQVSFWASFPADFIIWSESEFVNDILKFRAGYPLYGPQVNNDSFIYTPGTQLLTYGISVLLGNETSLTLYRYIQVGYTLAAALVALVTVRTLVGARFPEINYRALFPWSLVWLPLLFLIATNPLTNPFAHNLHNDSLAVLVSVAAYLVLARYALTKDRNMLILMAVIPALGFLVKQPLAIWAGLYLFYLIFFDRPFSLKRIVPFGLVAFGSILLMVLGGYLIWGSDFMYWMFVAAGSHDISPLRSFQHVMDTWPYFAIGLVGGAVMLRGKFSSPVWGLWAVWVVFIGIEAYTSGIGWMLNHLAPGSLIGAIWFVAALTVLWSDDLSRNAAGLAYQKWFRYGITVAVLLLLFGGMGIVRTPVQPFSDDAYRYVSQVQLEFQGESVDKVLLDSGSWIYLDANVVMQDRVASIGDRGRGGTGDFSGILGRIEERRYDKIMMRRVNHPDFNYDHESWQVSSGIRQALLDNYQQVRLIEAVDGDDRLFFSEINVLIPKQ